MTRVAVSTMTPAEGRAWEAMARDGTLSRFAKSTTAQNRAVDRDQGYELALAERMARIDCERALAELRARS